ncbi:urease accessory UreF family protein [uncultured Corynebacterium sp.]|uniref:urease accessory protein UreF n=1 Tax=uncultured Corynebacterium sp. TaxID=159447 RepID=UPI0025FB0CF1|nr:urease accessory UreF family protein [uncultured Corynebacterium sp.]
MSSFDNLDTTVNSTGNSGQPSVFPAFLSALQWTDTAFPSGMYTLSHGLEGLSQCQWLDRASLTETVRELITDVVAPTDGIAAALAWSWAQDWRQSKSATISTSISTHSATETTLRMVDEVLLATKPSDYARRGSTRVGKQLLSMADDVLNPDEDTPLGTLISDVQKGNVVGNQAIVAGIIHHHNGLSQEMAVSCELFSFAAGACSAAVRLSVADHISAQQIVSEVGSDIAECVQRCCDSSVDDIGTLSPALDIASAAHESAPARLFIN